MISEEVQRLLTLAHQGKLKRFITPEELLHREGLIKEYFEGKVEEVRETSYYTRVRIGRFLVYIYNFEQPIFIGDLIRFRNFFHRNGVIRVESETMIVKRAKARLRLSEGILYLVKGEVSNNLFYINGKGFPIEGLDLRPFEGKTLVLQRVMFKNNSFKIMPDTKVFLVKR